MEEDKKVVDGTQDATLEKEGVDDSHTASDDIDYAAELSEALEREEKANVEKDNYKRGLLKAKGKFPEEENGEDEIAKRVAEELRKQLPQIHASLAADNVDQVLQTLTSDVNEQKLIRHHFENSVGTTGTIRERLENAQLIANKKTILKKGRELGLALKNRKQFLGSGIGGNSEETLKVKDSSLSAHQIADLKKRGWNDAKIELFKKNARKNGAL